MSPGSSLSIVFLWKSIQIVEAFSPLDFGKVFKMLWEPIFPLVPPFIPSQVVKYKDSIKLSKTCSEPVLSHSERVGRNLFHSPSLLRITASNLVWAWYLLI